MRRTIIVLILLLCIGSVTAAVVGFQENWHWQRLAPPSADASKDPAPQLARSQAENGQEEKPAAIEAAPRRAPDSRDPRFDIVRIDPEGASVFAGRAKPDGNVTVFVDGEPIGFAHTDANGEWVLIVEHVTAMQDSSLSLKFSAIPANLSERSASVVHSRPHKSVDDNPSRPAPKLAAATLTADLINDLRQLIERARARNGGATERSADNPSARRSADDRPSTRRASLPVSETLGTGALPERVPNNGSGPNQIVATSQSPNTSLGKSDSPVHGVNVPIPIKFVFDKAVLTDDGRQAAQLLIEYVMLEKFQSLKLTGHADERGTHAYNLALSSERLEAIADMLRAAGFSGKLHLVPMGDTAPFTGVDRSRFSQEALYDLDRRVELREAQPKTELSNLRPPP